MMKKRRGRKRDHEEGGGRDNDKDKEAETEAEMKLCSWQVSASPISDPTPHLCWDSPPCCQRGNVQ